MKNIITVEDFSDYRKLIIKEQTDNKPCIVISAGTCGQASGANDIIRITKRYIVEQNLHELVSLRITGCLGNCEMEPFILVEPSNTIYPKIKMDDVPKVIDAIIKGKVVKSLLYKDNINKEIFSSQHEIPFFKHQTRTILGKNQILDPIRINDYISTGGYEAFDKIISKLKHEYKSQIPNPKSQIQDWIINEIKDSELRGRGGAGFFTGKKWEFARKSVSDIQKYIICNADEGDPGAYMDRGVLEGNPHSIIEGMLIAGIAIGATKGFIYVRTEYPLAIKHSLIAIRQAKDLGILGENIMGTDITFDIDIVKGAGAFVCGEETALIKSIEGQMGQPKQRPPYPVNKGLWGCPTCINNVETLANVPVIISKGAKKYAEVGVPGNRGTKIFSLVGKVKNTGLVEVPFGTTIHEIVYKIGGGHPEGKRIKAIQTGGPSGGCIPENLFHLPVDYESLMEAGTIMGSGGMIVMDEDNCMVDIAKYFTNFLQEESCGKCSICREGTQRMYEILNNITEGNGKIEDLDLLEELGKIIKDASMCGLGQTAANPLLATLRHFRNEYEEHIVKKRCTALVCKRLIPTPCQDVCPAGVDVASYIALIAWGKFNEAVNLIREDNPFPAICGRVCNHPCELNCKMGELEEQKPVSIRSLKRFCADYVLKHGGYEQLPRLDEKEEKVAIIGSGPAGLTAAYNLARLGYRTTVFEALPVAGGMLSVGIPSYRLPKEIVKAEIDEICKTGVEIKTNTPIGKDISIDKLKQQGYKVIFIATGAHKALKLGLPGENGVEGIINCLDFLKEVNLGSRNKPGDKIIIVGDDHAAVDLARVCKRLGSSEVNIIYRRTKEEIPIDDSEIEQAYSEGVKFYWLSIPKKILNKEGKVAGVQCISVKTGEADSRGRTELVPVKGSEFVIDADAIIPAVNQEPDINFLDNRFNISNWNNIVVDIHTFQTSVPGVFAGGDVVTGPAMVIEAIAAGKKAAASIDSYLKSEEFEGYKRPRPRIRVEPVKLTEEDVELKRPDMPLMNVEKRSQCFEEVELGFTEEMAIREAKRCRRCDL